MCRATGWNNCQVIVKNSNLLMERVTMQFKMTVNQERLEIYKNITTHYKWQCVGQHGGTSASNCQKLKLLMEHVTMQFEMAARLVQLMI